MHSAVDAGPSWSRVQLAAIASYESAGFPPSFHDPQDHKAKDTQPFLIIPRVPTYSWKWDSWSHSESPFSFAEKGDPHGKTAYSRGLIYCYQRTNAHVST